MKNVSVIKNENALPTITIPYRSAILLTIHLQNVQAQRSELGIVKDIIERIGVNKNITELTRDIGGGRAMINPTVDGFDDVEVQLAPQEIRVILKTLNEITITVNDLIWIEPLASQLEKKVG